MVLLESLRGNHRRRARKDDGMTLPRICLGMLLIGASSCDYMLTRPSLYSSVPVSVTLVNGDPVAGVHLELYTGFRPMDFGATGTDGRHTFEHVPLGNY